MMNFLVAEDWDVMVDLFFFKKVDEVAALPEAEGKGDEDRGVNFFICVT